MRFSLIFSIHSHLRKALERIRGGIAPLKRPSKYYPRLPRISMEKPGGLQVDMLYALEQRHSTKNIDQEKFLEHDEVRSLLGSSLSRRESGGRPYPSGGALYPIETYVIVQKVKDIPRAVYHYDPHENALEQLWDIPTPLQIFSTKRYGAAWANDAPLIIIFTGMWERGSVKYDDFAYFLGVVEAGHMAQNILLLVSALGLAASPLCGFDDQDVTKLLDLDEHREQPIYAIAIGKRRTDENLSPTKLDI
jgi:SagB-type dehydrogenase family enzyme